MGARISEGCAGSVGGYTFLLRLSQNGSRGVFVSLLQTRLCISSSLLTATAVTSETGLAH